MKMYTLGLIFLSVLFMLLAGCCGCNRSNWPASPELGHMDLDQKQVYMDNVRQNLTVFQASFDDIERQTPEISPDDQPICDENQYSCEVYRYVETYAMPIISDETARTNLQTRREVAQINLLSAYALYQAQQFGRAKSLVKMFEKQYGEDPSILNSPVDSNELGFSTFGEGLRLLKRKLIAG
ncbi:MAG: hypothetical protein R2940_05175 [Syntrophotaleaceae bacterium]